MKAASLRARIRAEMADEIKAMARRQLATQGADLSLRAVARDLGMASSAVYRYFASRDELLTALIIDAYDALGAAAEAVPHEGSFPEQWLAVCHAVREWALADPHQWALIYGSPVPGYRAPTDTVASATRVIMALARVVRDAAAAGKVADGEPVDGPLAQDFLGLAGYVRPGVAPQVAGRTMAGWVQLCGAVNAELFGQLTNVVEARREFFGFQMRAASDWIGLR
ncbi:TetR/AcrR family transcriptional regulator [Actinoplanes sp. N902-109]|uniref:TetR/AcrR family transcriptional regulator n=1 Tax=Actinoplanes sp. (strain N902-109) TaxID=649831 RepID=UPI0003295E8F|nr:TetR/AcrR family transcriptional regulator [Actinoplanes sp. N902-109]AGL14381.1 TetR family transcriptional regulator [Actinoplanes sp. N902-109]